MKMRNHYSHVALLCWRRSNSVRASGWWKFSTFHLPRYSMKSYVYHLQTIRNVGRGVGSMTIPHGNWRNRMQAKIEAPFQMPWIFVRVMALYMLPASTMLEMWITWRGTRHSIKNAWSEYRNRHSTIHQLECIQFHLSQSFIASRIYCSDKDVRSLSPATRIVIQFYARCERWWRKSIPVIATACCGQKQMG